MSSWTSNLVEDNIWSLFIVKPQKKKKESLPAGLTTSTMNTMLFHCLLSLFSQRMSKSSPNNNEHNFPKVYERPVYEENRHCFFFRLYQSLAYRTSNSTHDTIINQIYWFVWAKHAMLEKLVYWLIQKFLADLSCKSYTYLHVCLHVLKYITMHLRF